MSLFRITINWYGEIHVLHTSSSPKTKALTNAIHQLSKKVERSFTFVRSFVLDETKDRYKIEEIKKEGGQSNVFKRPEIRK